MLDFLLHAASSPKFMKDAQQAKQESTEANKTIFFDVLERVLAPPSSATPPPAAPHLRKGSSRALPCRQQQRQVYVRPRRQSYGHPLPLRWNQTPTVHNRLVHLRWWQRQD